MINDKLTDKFQNLFDSMGSGDKVTATLDFYEVSKILALLKSSDIHMKSLEENLLQGFDKPEFMLR